MRGGDGFRGVAGGGREIQQGLFVAGDKGHHAAQKTGLPGRRAQMAEVETRKGEKSRQSLGIAGEIAQARDGELFGLVTRMRP